MKQFNIPSFFKSELISGMKAKRRQEDRMKRNLSPYLFDFGAISFYLPRDFGFCYGVENAIDIIYEALQKNPGKRVFVLSELIHNDQVNKDLRRRGVDFLMDTFGRGLIPFSTLTRDDIVIIPAFGTDIDTQEILYKQGVDIKKYNTTCPFVKRVWNKVAELGREKYTIVLHGKYYHEESRATFSRAAVEDRPCVIIKDMEEAKALAQYMRKEKGAADFFEEFKGKHTPHFNPNADLTRIGLINQTTMLASETQAIGTYLKKEIETLYPDKQAFADTRDTLCYATHDNQSALAYALSHTPLDLCFVIGGHKSSNTTNLFRYSEATGIPTYFLASEAHILSPDTVLHFDYNTQKEKETPIPRLFKVAKKILIILGASCPDMVAEKVMCRILSFQFSLEDCASHLSSMKAKLL